MGPKQVTYTVTVQTPSLPGCTVGLLTTPFISRLLEAEAREAEAHMALVANKHTLSVSYAAKALIKGAV
jgi:hypothetical protein